MTHAYLHSRRLRGLLAAALAAGLALTVAACSSDSAPVAEKTSTTASTRTVSTPEGKVTVPSHPLRVVSVHSWTTESLLDLGVTPLGVEDSGAEYVPQRYLARWTKIDKVAQGATVDFEKIAALKPDLIVGVDVPYLKKDYAKLSAIAPTVLAPFGDDQTWQDYPTYTADYVGANAKLAALKKKYDSAVAAAKTEYAPQLASIKWDVVQGGFDAGNYWIYSTTSPVGSVLTQLGAQFASATAAVKPGGQNSVSYEKTDLLADADEIIYYTNNDGTPANDIDKLFALQGYQNLPAVKAGHTVGTPDFLPGSYSDALGLLGSITDALKKDAAQ
ncbi:ABC transporter substrate-binding protein [Gryllotalpicola protaetiae]|uniref:ABC transporter substrate-binding protein n=1 Tax=Gryllotalpicola protaetiae TaxID=2419771 RepID=UPI0013C4FC42|nr:ABC transporter substrate-binding protein [Gryllotalpicola protaetiae]